MKDTQDKITQLQTLLSQELNEKLIVQSGEALLTALRHDWKRCKDDFSDSDITLLQNANTQITALKRFIEEQEDFDYISTQEEVDEAIGRLHAIVESLEGLQVAGRVNKEIRELLQRRVDLPSQAGLQQSLQLQQAISSLNAHSPLCDKCGSKMVIREGNGEYFWGCLRFPECWGKKRLTNEENSSLSGDSSPADLRRLGESGYRNINRVL